MPTWDGNGMPQHPIKPVGGTDRAFGVYSLECIEIGFGQFAVKPDESSLLLLACPNAEHATLPEGQSLQATLSYSAYTGAWHGYWLSKMSRRLPP